MVEEPPTSPGADGAQTGENVCPRCAGTGTVDGDACDACGGRGLIDETVGDA